MALSDVHRDSRSAALCGAHAAPGAGGRGRTLGAAPALGLSRFSPAAHAVSRQPHAARLCRRSRPAGSRAMSSASTKRPRRSSAMSSPCLAPQTCDGEPGPARDWKKRCCAIFLSCLLNSPHVDRIESQLLLHPVRLLTPHSFAPPGSRSFAGSSWCRLWRAAGVRRRPICLANLELRPWREADLAPAARLICEAYRGHPDSLINDQYRSVHGSMRFLNNIVRYAGCGTFLRARLACGGGARKPRAGRPWCWARASAAERPPDTGLRSPCLSPPRAGPHASGAGRVQLYPPGRSRNLPHRHRGQRRGHRLY